MLHTIWYLYLYLYSWTQGTLWVQCRTQTQTIDTEIDAFRHIVVFYIDLHWFKFGLPPFSFENGPNGGASQQDRLLLSGLSAKPKPDHHSHSNWRFQTNLLQFYINHNISSQNISLKPTYCKILLSNLHFYNCTFTTILHSYMFTCEKVTVKNSNKYIIVV